MNRIKEILVIGSLVIVIISLTSINHTNTVPVDEIERESVTFILGSDRTIHNPYYEKAASYYRNNVNNRTERVVTHCTSLFEVQEYLTNNRTKNGLPWGHINLVSHGNQYLGLSMKITPDGKRTTAERLHKSLEEGSLIEIPTYAISNSTKIELHGCGIGKDEELVSEISKAFSNDTVSPQVIANEYFEYYVTDFFNEEKIIRFNAEYWFIRYKMGYRPNDRLVIRRLNNLYPDDSINWKEALSKTSASEPGEVFHYTFDIPVKWVFRYDSKDSVPILNSKKSRLKWASENKRIMSDLEKLEIQPEEINWWMRNIYVKNPDGSKTPALWVKGYCTILCVLRLKSDELSN